MNQKQDSSKVVKSAAKTRKPPAAGKGRVKGTPNKITRELKEMILQALEQAGGVSYLYEQAIENPKAFLPLLGRILPLQVSGDPNEPLVINIKRLTDG